MEARSTKACFGDLFQKDFQYLESLVQEQLAVMAEYQTVADMHKTTIESYKSQNSKLSEEIGILHETIRNNTTTTNSILERYKQLQRLYEIKTTECQEKDTQIESLRGHEHDVRQQVESLQKDIEKLKVTHDDDLKSYRKTINDLQQRVLNTNIVQLHCDNLRKQLQAAQQETTKLKEELKEKRLQKESDNKHIDDELHQNGQLSKENKMLQAQVTNLRNQLELQQQTLSKQKTVINELNKRYKEKQSHQQAQNTSESNTNLPCTPQRSINDKSMARVSSLQQEISENTPPFSKPLRQPPQKRQASKRVSLRNIDSDESSSEDVDIQSIHAAKFQKFVNSTKSEHNTPLPQYRSPRYEHPGKTALKSRKNSTTKIRQDMESTIDIDNLTPSTSVLDQFVVDGT